MNAAQFLDWADANRPIALTLAAVLLVALVLAARWSRGNQAAAYRWAAGAVALALSAEGMWEVATEALGLAGWKAALLFAFAELAMLNEARQAKKRVDKDAGPGVHGAAVWVIAVGAGAIAASNATSVTEMMLRLFAPTLIAWQWWSDLTEDRESTSRWVWTPERIGVRLGVLKPGGSDDLEEVFRQRRIDRMVKLADRLDLSSPRRARRLALRLRRMAAGADPKVIEAVADRYWQGTTVQTAIFGRVRVEMRDRLTQPGDAPADTPMTQPSAAAATHADADLTRVADAVMTRASDALPTHALRALPPAVTRTDATPARRVREVVMRRPESVPPADAAERDAALTRALDAVLTQGLSNRAAAANEGLPEATVRRAVTRARAEMTQPHNGYEHSTT